VGVEGLFTPGAVMELINGVPKYNPAVSAAAPGRPPPQYTPGDAPWVSLAYHSRIAAGVHLFTKKSFMVLVNM
jgi:hypothetical protein